MWRIYKTSFEAAHHIEGHPRCGKTHGHSYKVVVKVLIDKEFYDFHDLRKTVDALLYIFDHKDLGHRTCEGICGTIMHGLKNLKVYTGIIVEVWETHEFGCSTEWFKDVPFVNDAKD